MMPLFNYPVFQNVKENGVFAHLEQMLRLKMENDVMI